MSSSLTRPLTRGFERAKLLANMPNVNRRPQHTIKTHRLAFFARSYHVHYYAFPKIPRPNRRTLYYFGSVSIASSFRRFSIPHRPQPQKGAQFLANTKRLFSSGRRRLTKQIQGSPATAGGKRNMRGLYVATFIAIFFFGIVSRYEFQEYDQDDQIEEVDDETARQHRSQKRQPIRPTNVALYVYQRLPLNALSRLWGRVNRLELPEWARVPGFHFYSKLFGVNLDEMADPDLTHYHNLSEFFYRRIKQETRPIDHGELCAPCDGTIIKLGVVEKGEIEQVKGMTYSVEALLGTSASLKAEPTKAIQYPLQSPTAGDDISAKFLQDYQSVGKEDHTNNLVKYSEQGDRALLHPSVSDIIKISSRLYQPEPDTTHKLFYAVIYLSPGDYHHFHSPSNWVATTRRHFAGELYSVAPFFQRSFNNLFVLNERVALLGYWRHGFFSMTPVGATNVGSIKVNFDKDLNTNVPYIYPESQTTPKKVKKNTCYEATYRHASDVLEGQPLFKGDEMGGFMLGSTVVLCFEAPGDFQFTVNEQQHVKVGQSFGSVKD